MVLLIYFSVLVCCMKKIWQPCWSVQFKSIATIRLSSLVTASVRKKHVLKNFTENLGWQFFRQLKYNIVKNFTENLGWQFFRQSKYICCYVQCRQKFHGKSWLAVFSAIKFYCWIQCDRKRLGIPRKKLQKMLNLLRKKNNRQFVKKYLKR
jgi:hypothetical protein